MEMVGQEYHYYLTGLLRNSLSICFVDGWVPLATLLWPSFMRGTRTSGSWRILQSRFPLVRAVRERISVAGYEVFKVQMMPLMAAARRRELIENTVQHDQVFARQGSFQSAEQYFLLR